MANAIEGLAALLTISGMAYMVLALLGARDFVKAVRHFRHQPEFTPPVTLMKPLKGIDQRMYAGLASHCRQVYAGPFEIIFGIHRLDDPAAIEIERLRGQFPGVAIKLVVCHQRLGTSGKVSNLVQMLPHASFEHIIINDSDILVGPGYLSGVMQYFQPNSSKNPVGMVTAPYIGRTDVNGIATTIWARLEALGISTDFMPGVLTARRLEGGIHFGMGSTLAMTRAALGAADGLAPLLEYLADDYMIGYRISHSGFRVELCGEVVETAVPGYGFGAFWDHQMRWARSTRDSRKLGHVGLGLTYCLPWALLTVISSGGALWSYILLTMAMLARVSVALTVGVGLLHDDQVLRDLWLLPLRDAIGLLVWFWSFAGDTVIWRGEKFHLREGRITRA